MSKLSVSQLEYETHPTVSNNIGNLMPEAMSQQANKYLEITNLVKKYGDFCALKEISLTINEGEFISFLGPSGCGKTTLLRTIAGLDFHTSGTLVQGGVNISELPPNKRDFGIVFQSYALFPNLSIEDNVAYGLVNQGKSKDEVAKRVTELLETVGLSGSEKKFPSQLSGGQQQRIALARALATSPGLLLLDEPLSALDAQVRLHLRREIKELQNKLGVTTIMVTHDQEEAMTMADRIVVMNHGVIEQVGTPEEIYQNPATVFVADFVGSMNFMPCQVSSESEVAIDDTKLNCNSFGSGLTGQSAIVAIRPEDIEIGQSSENCLEATVDDIEFLGSYVRLKVRYSTNLSLTAEVSMNLMRDLSIKIGELVKISLPVDHLHLFSEDK